MSAEADNSRSDGAAILARATAAGALVRAASRAGLSLDGVWLVGGAVRDALLDRDAANADVDLAVEGPGHAFAHLLASATGGALVAEHDFGTATVRVPLGAPHGMLNVDIATCRTETYVEPGALPIVRLDATIEQDLARRDVTANAVAVALTAGPNGQHAVVEAPRGLDDLSHRLLRVLHDGSFIDDPTRIFRVARYAGQLGLRVEPHTRTLAIEAVTGGALGTVSAERVRTELQLALTGPAWETLTFLASWGVTERLDPRLEAAFHPPLLLRSIDAACGSDAELNRRAWTLRLAALTRPLGIDSGGWMTWLGFPGDVIATVVEHIRVLDAVLSRGELLRGLSNSRLYIELGEVTDDSMALAALAIDDDPMLLQRLVEYAEATRATRLTVRGDDVIAAGVPTGPIVGRILGDLFLRSLDGELQGEIDERRVLAELVAEARQVVEDEES